MAHLNGNTQVVTESDSPYGAKCKPVLRFALEIMIVLDLSFQASPFSLGPSAETLACGSSARAPGAHRDDGPIPIYNDPGNEIC